MTAIPEDVQRLADRLRMAADEIESAARYGVPIPFVVSITGSKYGHMTFHASEHEFDAWADYTEAEVEDVEHANGELWSRATVVINGGLPVAFAVHHRAACEVSA
jgi:hypothetical protein